MLFLESNVLWSSVLWANNKGVPVGLIAEVKWTSYTSEILTNSKHFITGEEKALVILLSKYIIFNKTRILENKVSILINTCNWSPLYSEKIKQKIFQVIHKV